MKNDQCWDRNDFHSFNVTVYIVISTVFVGVKIISVSVKIIFEITDQNWDFFKRWKMPFL